jgi:hemerythrin
MPFIIWDELYETGVPAIDMQHKSLVSLANRMLEVLLQQKGQGEVSYILEQLVQYAETHFTTEEECMRRASYSGISEHMHEHEAFRQKIIEFQQKNNARDLSLSGELTIFLTTWITGHFAMVDQKYVPALKSAGLTVSS